MTSTLTSSVAPRLALICAENPDIKRQLELKPRKPIPHINLPASYTTPGGLQQPMEVNGAEYATVRRFQLTIEIMAVEQGVDVADLGDKAIREAVGFLDWFPEYFVKHPRLQTDELSNLVGCMGVSYIDTGPVILPAPPGGGGSRKLAVIILLDITMADIVDEVEP